MNGLRLSMALSLLALAFATASLGAAGEPQVRQSGNVSYVSGGVSEEARGNLQALGSEFNLKLVLATKSGSYLSDVDVEVVDGQGKRLLEARSDGPWFYAKLPNGTYRIAASANGTTVRKTVTIAPHGQHKVDFRWDD